MKRSGSLLVVLSTWLPPFAVAAAGFGVHYALHVPPGPLPPPSPAKAEEDRKAADRKKKDDERKKKEEDRKAGRKSPPTRVDRSVKDLPYEPFTAPRSLHILEQLWAYYEPLDFKKEPTFDAWQTAHKPLVAQIVQATRQAGFAEPPAISVSSSECHTIRCRFSLTGADEAELLQLTEHLRALEFERGSLWHSFDATAPVTDKKDAARRLKSQVTISFVRDMPPLAAIVLPGKGALSLANAHKPASTPTPPPTPTPPTTPSAPTGKPGRSTGPTTPGAAPHGFPTPADAPVRGPAG